MSNEVERQREKINEDLNIAQQRMTFLQRVPLGIFGTLGGG